MAAKEEKTIEAAGEQAVSSETPAEIPVKKQETVGETLRRARLEKKQEIRDIASYLCIRAKFLEDIEEGRNKELPGTAYAVGFVRSYAAYLGLNAADMVSRYKEELAETSESDDTALPVTEDDLENSAPGVKVVLISLLLLAAVYGVFKAFWDEADNTDYASVETVSVVEDVYRPDTSLPAVETVPAVSEERPVAPVPPPKPEAARETAESAETAAVSNAVEEEGVVRERRIYGQKNYDSRVVLVASSDAWIEVTRGDTVLISRTLKAGDRYQAPHDSDDLFLRTGNAGGLDVYVDGVPVPPLGPKNATRSRVSLDPEYLLPKTAED